MPSPSASPIIGPMAGRAVARLDPRRRRRADDRRGRRPLPRARRLRDAHGAPTGRRRWRRRSQSARPGRARRHAARLRRPRGDAAAARGPRRTRAGDPADREGRGVRPRRRACGAAPTTTSSSRSRRPSWSHASRLCCAAAARRTTGDEPLRFGDLEIDPRARTVAVRGREVELTQREFDLLLFLARHPGQVFSRDQLMDRVWRFPFYTDTTTVTVHVRRLRAKIEADPAKPRVDPDGLGRRLPLPPGARDEPLARDRGCGRALAARHHRARLRRRARRW